jgi:hypothetical protein
VGRLACRAAVSLAAATACVHAASGIAARPRAASWPQRTLFAEKMTSSQAILGASLFMLVSQTTSPEAGPYRLTRVDLATRTVVKGRLFAAGEVAVANGRVWVTGVVAGRPRVDEIDPRTLQVIHTLKLPPGLPASPHVAVAPGPPGSVWIGSNRTLLRVRDDDFGVLARASVPARLVATDLATDPQRRHLYVSFANVVTGGMAGATAIEYDAASGARLVRAAAKTLVGSVAGASLTAVPTGVWASFRTGNLGATIHLGQQSLALAPPVSRRGRPDPLFSGAMAASTLYGGGSLWIATATGAVGCVDAVTGRARARETVGQNTDLTVLAIDVAHKRLLALKNAVSVVALTPPAACWRAAFGRLPGWVAAADKRTLARVFDGATPRKTVHIAYPKKIAAIFVFDRAAVCGACSAPSNASLPRGRVVRLSYDRRSHLITGAYEFCDSRGSWPPARLCFRR